MTREELKQMLKEMKIKQYRLAEQLGYSEQKLCVLLRKPISNELKNSIIKALEVLQNEK